MVLAIHDVDTCSTYGTELHGCICVWFHWIDVDELAQPFNKFYDINI